MRRLPGYLAWTACLLLLLAVAAYFLSLARLKDIDELAREELGGLYLATDAGVLSYTREGNLDAPAVVLVHGFSTPKFVWEQVTPYLLNAGFQVIAYDHLGRGFSDRPAGPYDSSMYQGELSALIDGLGLSTPLTLVGYSMGGANVIDYAASYPEQVEQLVLIAPAGYMNNGSDTSLLVAPVIGEWLTTVFGTRLAHASIKREVEAGRAPADMLAKFEKQASYKGYTDALLSTLRHFPMGNLAHRYQAVGRTHIPVTAIWGTQDKVVPYAGAARMTEDIPQLELITLEGANHSVTFGQADVVAQALLDTLGPAANR